MKQGRPGKMESVRGLFCHYIKGAAGFVLSERGKNDTNPRFGEKSIIGMLSRSSFMAEISSNPAADGKLHLSSIVMSVKGSKEI